MNLDIRALTYDLLDDYIDFFDNIAFSDHKEWSGCYCVHFHLEEESLRSAIKNKDSFPGSFDNSIAGTIAPSKLPR